MTENNWIYFSTCCLGFSSVQFSRSVVSDSLWPMKRNTPGLPVHQKLSEFTQTHVHRVGDIIQPSHPLSSPSPPAPNPSQHQSCLGWWYAKRWKKVCRVPCTTRVPAWTEGLCVWRASGWPNSLEPGCVTHHLSPCVDLCADLAYLLCHMEFWNLETIYLATMILRQKFQVWNRSLARKMPVMSPEGVVKIT